MSLPTVDVVIPCYRYGHFLEQCVRSVLDQPGVAVRVLIIDDASPDDSGEVAEQLAAKDDRVEVRRHRVNAGHIATYNEGLLEWAKSDFSVLLSADDLLTPGSLARAAAVLTEHPEVGFVYGHALSWTDGTPPPVPREQQTGVTVWSGPEWLRIVLRLAHSVVSSPEVVVRTSVQQQIGGYLPELPHSGDTEMWMRFAAHSGVAFIKGVDQAIYRAHGTNMTTERVPLVDLRQRKAAYDALFESHAARVPSVDRLRRGANRKLAREALWTACRAFDRRRMDTTPIDALSAFAAETYPQTRRLPEYWSLRWRRYVGPRVCPYLQPLILSAVRRRVADALWWRRWARQGV